MKANVPVREVVRLAEARALDTLFDFDEHGHGELIRWKPGEYPIEHRTTELRIECRGMPGWRARQITEGCYRTTIGSAHFMTLSEKRNATLGAMKLVDQYRMLERMRPSTVERGRRRSGRQALLEVDRLRLGWY
jgi:hypothetical protein